MPLGKLGKYERLDVLGHGASGIVYLAKDTFLGRQIALKEISAQGEERDRVLEEARVLDRLRHPNIVQVYGVDEIDGKVVLAMEYVAGKNLQDVLRRTSPLPFNEAIDIMAQVCDGLAFAHQNRIVHRDIKPANILITADGTVKLVDFGLAQVLGTNSFAGGAGTYAYMAPEDFHEESTSDHQADIWAAGVIFYEMLTGKRPFQAAKVKDPFSWKRSIEESPLIPIHALQPDIPPEVDAIAGRALARNKAERYADAAKMAQDLRALTHAAVKPWQEPEQPVPSEVRWAVFPGSSLPANLDDFLHEAPDHWEAARAALTSGALAHWLQETRELPLSAVAQEMASDDQRAPDDRLRDFLYRAGLETGPEAYQAHEAGVRLARAGRFADAVPCLHRAVHLDPTRPVYHEDLASALRASGKTDEAVLALEEGLLHHPQQRVLKKQHVSLAGAQASLSAHAIDFGLLRQGQTRTSTITVMNRGTGVVEGRVASAPGWIQAAPLSFTTRRRQRLSLTANGAHVSPVPAEYRETVVIELAGKLQEIAVRASILPARKNLRMVYWWYVPLLVCCLLPALAGWETRMSAHLSGADLVPPGLASTTLLLAALFMIANVADTTWALRLLPCLFLGLAGWGASPLIRDFATLSSATLTVRTDAVQTATPALVMFILLCSAVFISPSGWGRWPLWAWITALTGIFIGYGLLQMGIS